MRTLNLKIVILVALLLAGSRSALHAQQYSIDWYKVSGGGGTSTNGQYSLSGTIGQHDAGGPMTGGNYSLTGGFWALYAMQTPGLPLLYISRTGPSTVFVWWLPGPVPAPIHSKPTATCPPAHGSTLAAPSTAAAGRTASPSPRRQGIYSSGWLIRKCLLTLTVGQSTYSGLASPVSGAVVDFNISRPSMFRSWRQLPDVSESACRSGQS
jgi:hypothetical protein